MTTTTYHTSTTLSDDSRTRGAEASAASVPYLGASVPVGLAGASAVALFILLLDSLAGQPLGTPNALGATLLRGEAFDPTAPIRPALVFGYTLLHVATFIAVGAAAVSAEFTMSREGASLPFQLVTGVAGLLIALQSIFLALTLLLDLGWVGGIGFERILAANAIAALTMAITVHLRGEARRLEREERGR
jgi:hypothetical protein